MPQHAYLALCMDAAHARGFEASDFSKLGSGRRRVPTPHFPLGPKIHISLSARHQANVLLVLRCGRLGTHIHAGMHTCIDVYMPIRMHACVHTCMLIVINAHWL